MKKILITIVVILSVLVILPKGIDYIVRSQKPDFSTTNIEIAENMISRENYIVIDVRTEEEYNEEHIVGAVHIPYEELLENISSYKELIQGKEVIVYLNESIEAFPVCNAIIESEYAFAIEIRENDTISLEKEVAVPMTGLPQMH